MTDTAALTGYQLGRPLAELQSPYKGIDRAYAGQRLDGVNVNGASYEHCTFANLSFKEVLLENAEFLDCVFIGCYFRRAQLANCRFVGCRFFDCNFAHVAIKSCDFKYAMFRGCQISFSEMHYSLPPEPNLREELARNLALESSRLGLSQEARRYRMVEIRAHEEHLVAAFLGKSEWYRTHFEGLGKAQAFLRWLASLLNRWLWGYGERAFVLVRNLLLLAFVIFPGLFFVWRDELIHESGRAVSVWDTLYFSLENVIPAGIVSNVIATGATARAFAGLESLFGVIAIGLFAAYIFRWSLHR